MKRSTVSLLAGLCGVLFLGGCKNAIIGDWRELGGDCASAGRFTVDSDLSGDGTMYLATNSCNACDYRFDITDNGSDKYTADISFINCSCVISQSNRATADCRMNSDSDQLDCYLDLGACGQLGDATYKKQ